MAVRLYIFDKRPCSLMLPRVFIKFLIIKILILVNALERSNMFFSPFLNKASFYLKRNCNVMYERMDYMGTLCMTDNKASAAGHDSRKRSISVFPLEVLIGATST